MTKPDKNLNDAINSNDDPDRMIAKNVYISVAVWRAICEKGNFGDSLDAVLRKVLELPAKENKVGGRYTRQYLRKVTR